MTFDGACRRFNLHHLQLSGCVRLHATNSINNLKTGLSTVRDWGAVLQARIVKVTLPFTLLAFYVVWMQGRSDRVVSSTFPSSLRSCCSLASIAQWSMGAKMNVPTVVCMILASGCACKRRTL